LKLVPPETPGVIPALGSWEEAVLWVRAQPDMQELVRAAYYDDPLPAVAQRYWRSEEWAALRGYLYDASGKAALDVGAGRGIASFALACDGFVVTALEPDGSAVVGAAAIRQLAKEAGVAIEVAQGFSEELPFRDGQFDVVFARAALHHTRNLAQACREFFRVLKPGGRLVAIREHVISRHTDLPAFRDAHPLHRYYGGENAFLLGEYLDAISAAGFRISNVVAPFDSVINLAPNTPKSVLEELARRASGGSSALRRGLARAFRLPGAWSLIRRVLQSIDHRPGRLYSFVATRP
jgi:SAM-dependent methyltransferase